MMYRAVCSHIKDLICDYSVMDQSFDRVADALISHHRMVHGKIPRKLAREWSVDDVIIAPKKRQEAKQA